MGASEQETTTAFLDTDLIMTRAFQAGRERVFAAWTEPETVKHWWGPNGFTTPFCTIDLRPGWRLRYCMRSLEGRDYWGQGVYREIIELERIAYTDTFADADGNSVPPTHYGLSPDFPPATLVTVTLAERTGRTTLSLQCSMGSASASERGRAGARCWIVSPRT